MNNLVKLENGKTIVSSRDIASNFEKRHDQVLRDIDNKIKSLETSPQKCGHLFIENIYEDSYKREQREFLLTRDGFSFIVMGFTGAKADIWKLKYIDAFNKMESELINSKRLSPMEQLKLQYEVLDEHEERLSYLEGNMTVDFGQQRTLQNKAKSKIIGVLGGIKSHSYKSKSLRSKAFSAIWRDYKDYFNVASYRDTARVEFEKALKYLDDWQAQGRLLREIEDCNNQIDIEDIA